MKALLKFALALLCCTRLHAQSDNNEKSVMKNLSDQVIAWNEGNIDAFMQSYWNSDSVMYVGKSGITYGYNIVLQKYRQNFPDTMAMGKLSFDILQHRQLSPDYYFVAGKFMLKRMKGNAEGYFTLIFRKINGRWLIVVDHTS